MVVMVVMVVMMMMEMMEKYLLKCWRLSVCILAFCLSSALGDVQYLHSHRNSSIEFSCIPYEDSIMPFSFSLSRKWIRTEEVLYHNFDTLKPVVKDATLQGRISDRTSEKRHVNVSIEQLQGSDTDLYVCTFHYETSSGFENRSGRNKIVLYVEDYHIEVCSCSSYKPLIFSLSAAAGLLIFIILILSAVHCLKQGSGGQVKSQSPVAIYEEMNGVRQKRNSHVQDEDSSLYVRPRKENPYIN